MILDINNVESLIQEWAWYRNENFKYNWVVKGGWESWVQVDLVAYAFRVVGGVDIDVLREQPVYKSPRRRVDLLFNANLAPTNQQIPVEIKAQSLNNASSFVPGLEADVEKISSDLDVQYSKSKCLVMGIASTPEGESGMFNIRRGGGPIFKSVYSTGEVCVGIAIYNGEAWELA